MEFRKEPTSDGLQPTSDGGVPKELKHLLLFISFLLPKEVRGWGVRQRSRGSHCHLFHVLVAWSPREEHLSSVEEVLGAPSP